MRITSPSPELIAAAEAAGLYCFGHPADPAPEPTSAEFIKDFRGAGWRADCPKCVGSKFTCDEHFATPTPETAERTGK